MHVCHVHVMRVCSVHSFMWCRQSPCVCFRVCSWQTGPRGLPQTELFAGSTPAKAVLEPGGRQRTAGLGGAVRHSGAWQ